VARPDELQAAGAVVERAYRALGVDQNDRYLAHVRDAAWRARHCPILVAVDSGGGPVLGSVTYVPGPDSRLAELARDTEAEFRMLGVAPEAQGRGAGEALIRACIDRAREAGRTGIAISTSTRMRPAHRLYERLGFRRAPDRDWSPVPDVHLLAYVLDL
jgi:ribosomal protein S18 acetylase RimI-like enzyme